MTEKFIMTDNHYYLDWTTNWSADEKKINEFAEHWGLSLQEAKELTKGEKSQCNITT